MVNVTGNIIKWESIDKSANGVYECIAKVKGPLIQYIAAKYKLEVIGKINCIEKINP